ncbi:MAG TPA: glycosyl hydrolase [Cytophagaceae bacterium]
MRISERLFLLLALFLQIGGANAQTVPTDHTALSKANFLNPPVEARPRALWTWVNGNFDKSTITSELEEAKAKGMGGFDIWDVSCMQDEDSIVPSGEPFMSDKYTDAIAHAITEATRLGLDIGLVISSGWNSGGAWTTAENATMAIYRSVQVVKGPRKVSVNLPLPILPKKVEGSLSVAKIDENGYPAYYKDILVQAFPLTIDSLIDDTSKIINVSGKLNRKGGLEWNAPPGDWKIVRMVCANTGQPMIAHSPSSNGPMIDHYNPTATEIHIRYFLEKLKAKLGSFKGTAFKYLYTDSYEVRGELWTPNMLAEFEKRFGYSMIPFLPVFEKFTVISKDASQRFLYDYNQLLSDLIIDSHFLKAKSLCEEYGIGFVAEAAGPGQPLHNCPFESLKSSGVLTFPRGEFWHNPKDPSKAIYVIKGVASASHIYNQKYVEAEAFTSTNLWQESLNELKPGVDRAFCEGLNRINFHTFPHVPKAFGKPGYIYGFGTQVGVTQTWWPKVKPFMDYLARSSYMLQQGNFSAEVLYYYGDQSPNFVPEKHIDPALGFGYDYDVTNTDVILNKLSVENNRLSLPHGQKYSVLVLPDSKEMNLEVLKKLRLLVSQGAILIGPKPEVSVGYKDFIKDDLELKEIANEMWGRIDGTSNTENLFGKGKIIYRRTIRDVLTSLNVQPDVILESGVEPDSIDFIHRTTSGEDIYFISSKSKKNRAIKLKLKSAYRNAELWDPLTGKTYSVDQHQEGGLLSLGFNIYPEGSVFIVLSNNVGNNILRVPLFQSNKQQVLSRIWNVSFDQSLGGPKPIALQRLSDLSTHLNDSIRGYSGIITYTTSFKADKSYNSRKYSASIDLGVIGVVAEVYLNGNSLGTVWNSPYILPLDSLIKKGENILKIEVANRWVNRLIADSKLPPKQRLSNTNVTRLPNGWFYPMKNLPDENYKVPASGLLGPVKIVYREKSKLAK